MVVDVKDVIQISLSEEQLRRLRTYQAHLQQVGDRWAPPGSTRYRVTLRDAAIVLMDRGWRDWTRAEAISRPDKAADEDLSR